MARTRTDAKIEKRGSNAKCPGCKRGNWQAVEATRYEMSERVNAAISIGKCKHCGLRFIDFRKMTPAEIAAETKRLRKAEATAQAERERLAAARAERERLEAEKQERENEELMLARKQARKKMLGK